MDQGFVRRGADLGFVRRGPNQTWLGNTKFCGLPNPFNVYLLKYDAVSYDNAIPFFDDVQIYQSNNNKNNNRLIKI